MNGIGVLILPAVALLITTGIFVYQLRLYLRARRKNKKPTIPNFSIGPLPSPIPVAEAPKRVEKKAVSKKSSALFYYAAAIVGVSVVIVMFVTLSDEPFTFMPRASSPTPTIGILPSAQPTNLAGAATPTSVPINYNGTSPNPSQTLGTSPTPTTKPSPTVRPTARPSVTPKTSPTTKPSPTVTPRPSVTIVPTISALSTTPRLTTTVSPTPTPKTLAYVPTNTIPTTTTSQNSPTTTTTPGTAILPGTNTTSTPSTTIIQGGTKSLTTTVNPSGVNEIPQSGLINPSLFLLLAGGFILFLGFLF